MFLVSLDSSNFPDPLAVVFDVSVPGQSVAVGVTGCSSQFQFPIFSWPIRLKDLPTVVWLTVHWADQLSLVFVLWNNFNDIIWSICTMLWRHLTSMHHIMTSFDLLAYDWSTAVTRACSWATLSLFQTNQIAWTMSSSPLFTVNNYRCLLKVAWHWFAISIFLKAPTCNTVIYV